MADAFAADVFSILNFEDMPDGSVFTDEIPARTWTDQGSARIVSGEMILDGSSDWLQSDSKLDWEFLHDGSEDVTLDFKVYQNGSDSKCFVETGGHLATARGIHGRINTDNSITFLITNGSSNTIRIDSSASDVPVTADTVISIEIEGGVGATIYVDGTQVDTGTNTGSNSGIQPTNFMSLGASNTASSYDFAGKYKAFRCTKALRYEGNHTPDATPYDAPLSGTTAIVELSTMLGAVDVLGTSFAGIVSVPAMLGEQVLVSAVSDFTSLITGADQYAVDLDTPSGTVRVPVSSWQGTLQVERANYGQFTVQGAGEWLTELAAATAFSIYRTAIIDGLAVDSIMIGPCTSLLKQYYQTDSAFRCVVSGNYTTGYIADDSPPVVYDRTLTGPRSITTTPTGVRARADIDYLLRPAQRAYVNGSPIIVAYINYYVNVTDAYADYGERA